MEANRFVGGVNDVMADAVETFLRDNAVQYERRTDIVHSFTFVHQTGKGGGIDIACDFAGEMLLWVQGRSEEHSLSTIEELARYWVTI